MKFTKNLFYILMMIVLVTTLIPANPAAYDAFPAIGVEFDPSDQSVIVSGVPSGDGSGAIYELRGYLNYGNERIGTFCYAPSAMAYHIPGKQAYIFNWSDNESHLPCSGDYQFTVYLTKVSNGVSQNGPKTTITIHLTKKDESTNWGPGLPNTTVEAYDLEELKGKDKNIVIEETGYSWTINGKDIQTAPEQNLSLAIATNPENFVMNGVDEFFGDTLAHKFSIEHSGEFGFKATLSYFVGNEYSGKYANLFYVVGDGTFQFMEGGIVNENGYISYTFTHASDYVIAVTDVEYTGQELNPKVEEADTEEITNTEDLTTEDSSTTGTDVDKDIPDGDGPSALLWIGLLAIIITAGIFIYIIKFKK